MARNKCLITIIALGLFITLLISGTSFAQTLLTESFDETTFPPTGWALFNAGSGNNWIRGTSGPAPYAGAGAMQYQYNSYFDANAWAFTSNMSLTSGTSYYLEFYQAVKTASYAERLKVTIGQGQTVAAQTTTLLDFPNLTNTSYIQRTKIFTVPSSGTYNIAFNCYSAAFKDNLNVDEVLVRVAIAPDAPPINITFSSITQAGMTVGWTDNSTNEVSFRVYRSIDNITFTQVGSDITSTSGPTIGTLYSQAQTDLYPGTTYYFRIVAVLEGESPYLTGSQATLNPGSITSTGSGDWSSTTPDAPWPDGIVPTSTDNVTIADGSTVTIDAAASCNSLAVGQGASGILQFNSTSAVTITVTNDVTIAANGTFKSNDAGTVITHSLSLGGNLTNNGTLDFSTNDNTAGAVITFTGAANATFSGSGATTDLFRLGLTINKGTSPSSVLQLNTSNFTVCGVSSGPARPFLTLTNGTLRISGSFTMTDSVFSAAAYTIPATGGLWLDNANFTVQGLNGSPTNNGLLRISAGTYNVGNAANNTMSLATGSTFIMEGGAYNGTGRLKALGNITYNQSGGTITLATIVHTSNEASFGMGGGGLTGHSFTMSGGKIVIQTTSSGIGSYPREYCGPVISVPPGANINITGGILQLGNELSGSTPRTFGIANGMPELVISTASANHNAHLLSTMPLPSGAVSAIFLNSTIPASTSVILDGTQLAIYAPSLTNNGTINGDVAGSVLSFNGTVQQTISGTGTFTNGRIRGLTINNTSGASPAVRLNKYLTITTALTLTNGSLGGDSTLTLGASAASATLTTTRSGGSLANVPTFSLSGVTYNVTYTAPSPAASITTGYELPDSLPGTLTINNSSGVTLNAAKKVNILSFTSGILTTTSTNLLTVFGTTDGSVTRTAGYVSGPLARTLPASTSGLTWIFPIGKSAYQLFELVNPTTAPGNPIVVQAEVFDADCGGSAGTGLSAINTNRYWSASISGAGSLTNTKVRLAETGLTLANAIGQSNAVNGTYNYIGATLSGSTLLSGTITSLGYFVIGTKPILAGGTYNVGTTETYPNLTAVADELRVKALSGNVTFALTSNYSSSGETYPITFNAFGTSGGDWTATIKPAVGNQPLIQGSHATTIFDLNGVNRLIIDGGNKDLTISNTNNISGAAIRFIAGASFDTVKNCVIKGMGANTTTGVIFFSTGVGTGNNNNTILNCDITRGTTSPALGIYMSGSASALMNKNNIIQQCNIYDFSNTGIFIAANDSNTTITQNDIYTATQQTSTTLRGIVLSYTISFSVYGTKILRNKIRDLWSSNATTLRGIFICDVAMLVPTTIANNFIYLDATTNHSNAEICGIYEWTPASRLYNIYYNSIYIGGSSATAPSYGLYRASQLGTYNIKNNIIFNNRTGTASQYCIYSCNSGFAVVTSNYNDLYVPTPGANGQYTVYWYGLGNFATLSDWQLASGQDTNSISLNPNFISPTDLHINPNSTNVADRGTPISGITIDFDGDTRNATFPDIGGDEYVHGTPGVITLPSSNVFNQKLTVNPNPFTKLTTIHYTVPTAGKVSIKLYNTTGRLIETLINEPLNAGTYTMRLSSKNLAKGVYFLRYETMISRSEIKLIVQ